MNGIIHSINHGEVTALVLPDLSSAFDTVDHPTLINVLQHRFAIDGVILNWFESYLANRSQSSTTAMPHLLAFHNLLSIPAAFQNADARLVTNTKPWAHITPVLKQLHWLPANIGSSTNYA